MVFTEAKASKAGEMFKRDISARDYPYYNDQPASMARLDWIIILIALVIGFSVLTRCRISSG